VEQALYLCAYLFAQWCATFCVIGLAIRYLAAPSARWRYLADASYWMYLIHLPIVMLLQAWMLRWPLHWSVVGTDFGDRDLCFAWLPTTCWCAAPSWACS
jgi:peptidoglycan/LPS O-acetylase OafA/YrhL